MDLPTAILIPGFLGGLVVASVIILLQRRRTLPSVAVPYHADPITPDVINMASIKVAGGGGLGLVAMAVVVALDIPRIAQTVGLGILLGAVGAGIVIWRRRQTGVLPSSGRGMGANTTLAIDVPTISSAATKPHSDAIDRAWALIPH